MLLLGVLAQKTDNPFIRSSSGYLKQYLFKDHFCFVCYRFNLKSPRFCIFKATFVLPGYSFVFVKITFVLIFCISQGNFCFCLAMCETDGGSQRSLASALKQHWNSFNILQGSFCFAWYWLCALKTHFLLFLNFQTRFVLFFNSAKESLQYRNSINILICSFCF